VGKQGGQARGAGWDIALPELDVHSRELRYIDRQLEAVHKQFYSTHTSPGVGAASVDDASGQGSMEPKAGKQEKRSKGQRQQLWKAPHQ